MDPDLIEGLAEAVHKAWMVEKVAQGFADHTRTIDANGVGCCLNEKHHTDMLPYADIAENIKEYDRATVRAVLRAIDAAGLRLIATTSTIGHSETPDRG